MKAAQERAAWAWEAVGAATKLPEGPRKRYGTLARKLSSYVQVNGLGQTLAHLYAKAGRKAERDKPPPAAMGDELLLRQLGGRLRGGAQGGPSPAREDIMDWLVRLDADAYREASAEALEAAGWLKRFAEGRLEEEAE